MDDNFNEEKLSAVSQTLRKQLLIPSCSKQNNGLFCNFELF